MRLFYYLTAMITISFAVSAYAADHGHHDHGHLHHDHNRGDFSSFDEDLNERDFLMLREFVNSKRVYDIQEKACSLTISGDVRSEWRHLVELHRDRHNHERIIRGSKCYSANDFDIECNLRFDYVNDNAWAVAHLQFDNSAGVQGNTLNCQHDPQGFYGSGTDHRINLRKAFIGYNLCSTCDTRFDIEVGRRNLYNVFDSQIQFLSRFDGILFKYSSNWRCVGDWYLNAGAFVVNERINHFGWIAELGLLNICDIGIDLKYSFIDWRKLGRASCDVHNPNGFRFMNSQFTAAYHYQSDWLRTPVKLYGAFLVNHDAPRWINSDFKRANTGWYVGATWGRVFQEGDYAIDLQWQYVQAQAMPDRDVSGIGRGNFLDETFTWDVSNPRHARGNTNFKGARLEGLYALTDNLTLDTIIEYSVPVNKNIGGPHRFSKFELEAIYAW